MTSWLKSKNKIDACSALMASAVAREHKVALPWKDGMPESALATSLAEIAE